MTDIIAWTIDAIAVLVAGGIGYRAGTRKVPAPSELPKPICSCGHGYGTHGSDAPGCGGEVKRADKWDEYADPRHWQYVACPCRRYDGPDPVIFGLTP